MIKLGKLELRVNLILQDLCDINAKRIPAIEEEDIEDGGRVLVDYVGLSIENLDVLDWSCNLGYFSLALLKYLLEMGCRL